MLVLRTDSSCSIPEYNRDKYKCLASAYGGVGTFIDSRCDDENGNPIRTDGKGIAASISLCEGDRSEAANAPMTEIGDTTRPQTTIYEFWQKILNLEAMPVI